MKSNIKKLFYLSALLGLFTQVSCGPNIPDSVADDYESLPDKLDFNIHVKPILSDKCYACHGPDKAKQKAGLQLDVAEAAYGELPETPGKFAIVPGDIASSEAIKRILSDDPTIQMPTPEFNVPLSNYEKAVLVKWVNDGAEYKPHWAFIKPEKHEVPKIKGKHKDFITNPIDNFIVKTLEDKNLTPSKEAKKELLLRRLSLDLTGLPPTPEETKAFMADTSEDAYEKQVDRLLGSIHYAEKIATDWMDLSRYSDTYGYQVDRYRDMSPWRDWVIKAFNENMPYDEFIKWQLAGDLLPNPTKEQVLATGFNRLHPQNMEGGIVDEEFRSEYVSDRASLVGEAFMGLTVACAKCHDHKYDPISQKEFFQLYSFFNNVNETGQISWDNSLPVPTMMLPTEKQEQFLKETDQKIVAKEKLLASVVTSEDAGFNQWLATGAYKNAIKRVSSTNKTAHYTLNGAPIKNSLNQSLKVEHRMEFSKNEKLNFVPGHNGSALKMNGDAWLDLKGVGIFKRDDAFSIGVWVNIPKDLKEGVIFHKNKGSRLHSYKGYHLYLRDNKLEWMLAHTWPENAIIEHTKVDVPRDQWVHLMVTYDGSSSANGGKIYINGSEVETEVEKDNLTKDIIFHNLTDEIYNGPVEPNLQIGARWRGVGTKDAQYDDIEVFKRKLSAIEVMNLAKAEGIKEIAAAKVEELTNEQKQLLKEYYLINVSKPFKEAYKELAEVRSIYVDSVENVKEVMVMKEMEQPRDAFILERGVYDAYGEQVYPDTPKSVLDMPKDLPKNRLGLAEWLTLEEHPLTARVAVNRYWQNYFGRGIVKSTADFGNQGDLPSHPELLDWLALKFVDSGWNVKELQKLIVTSSTYKQDSYTPKELREVDSENVWLARGPSTRLTSEMMRDNALLAAGLLNKKVGGESVKPYQPEGLYAMTSGTYEQDEGDDLYRRSFYTYWRRTVPNPTLATFDQPERSVCTVKRQKTNTPLQALVLLNDPTYLEAAKVMGERMTKMKDSLEGIKMAYVRFTGKSPEEKELKVLAELQAKEYEKFKANPEKAKGWLEAGAYQIDESLDVNLLASNAIVASVILNGDVTITKR
ncbi:DUF1553 domain-containing protein [Aquimarina agarivorans]|uniref:DUF1553 domain-containing protein n=1 Tax=Aquimarina agarivorans TaxID=980584 RepID=UPI000248FC88|nr:DUF1553 domain-containing protein [Aquimarina agarivorans]